MYRGRIFNEYEWAVTALDDPRLAIFIDGALDTVYTDKASAPTGAS